MTGTVLTFSESAYAELKQIVAASPEHLETSATLFGVRQDERRVALFAVGPGPSAVCRSAYHAPDANHLNREFERLREPLPGLEWIGTLHAHPPGMPWLSSHDLGTVSRLLNAESLALNDFVAGVLQRRGERLGIYPYLLSRDDAFPWLLPTEIVSREAAVVREAEAQARRACAPPIVGVAIGTPRPWSRLAAKLRFRSRPR